MTESDYSIKPLQNLPNVTGLNPVKDREGQKKRQDPRKHPDGKPEFIEDGLNEFEENDVNEIIESDTNDHRIDYRA